MGLVLKTALNENTKNGKPKAFAQCDLQEVTTCISIQQIFVLFKLLAYINLNSLYRDGISKDFYTKELSEEEKQDYDDRHKTKYAAHAAENRIHHQRPDGFADVPRDEEPVHHSPQ